jgi:hypothetical protein
MQNPVHQAIVSAILAGKSVERAFFEVRTSLAGESFIIPLEPRRPENTEKLEWIVRDYELVVRSGGPKAFSQNRWTLAEVPDPECIASQLAGVIQPSREQIESAFKFCAKL